MNIFVFDIETIPDIAAGRQLYSLDETLTDLEVAQAMAKLRRQETQGSDFLRLHLQKIVAISVVLRTNDRVKVWSLGDESASEAEIIQRFFDGIAKCTPTLVSWNGTNFDLPVLHYRALIHGIQAGRYWESGEADTHFRWNNYLNRYHYRHTDLMDILAAYQPRAYAPLDEIAQLLGLPGKLGMNGAEVWPAFQRGEIAKIRNYCETDVLNTYLIYLRFELMRANLTPEHYALACQQLREALAKENKAHLTEFLAQWPVVD